MKLRIALCISGSIRSMPRCPFFKSIKLLIKSQVIVDVFFVLRTTDRENNKSLMNNEDAIDSVINTLNYLKVKKVIFFDNYEDVQVDTSTYSSQFFLIDKSINLADSYGNYDWFIRYRPDFILQDLNIDFNNLNINTIYTTKKNDNYLSDQVFMFSNSMKKIWWDKLRFKISSNIRNNKTIEENTIFESIPRYANIKNGDCFYGGLLRNKSKDLAYWDNSSPIKYKDIYKYELSDVSYIKTKYKELLVTKMKLYNIKHSCVKYLNIS